jgi:hypothetical protein
MQEMMKYTKSIFERIKAVLGINARNRKELKLSLGFSSAVLAQGRVSTYRFGAKGGSMSCDSRMFWKKIRKKVSLLPSMEPNPHMVIVGMSGFGKSTLLKSMLNDLGAFGVPAIIFDAHDEHESAVRSLGGSVHDSSSSGINIFDIGSGTVSARISELSNLLKSVYSLGYVQAMKLSQCLWYMYRKSGARGREARTLAKVPTIKDLLGEMDVFIRNSRTPTERNTMLHLRGRLSQLEASAFSKGFVSMEDMRHGLNSFSLGSMKSEEMRLIYIHELLRRLYQDMKGNEKEHGIGMYIVIDEAEFLISSSGAGSYMIDQLIQEGRKYGVGVILATHTASDLSKRIIANAATFISFYPREPSDVNYIANIISGGMPEKAMAVKQRLHNLKVNEAMLISGRFREPLLLSTPEARKAGPLSNDDYRFPRQSMQSALELAKNPIRSDRLPKELVGMNDSELSRIGIDAIKIEWGDGEERWLMARNRSLSIEHEVYVTKISESLSEHGISNQIIDNSHGPDLIAYSNGGRIAIEYETGRKNIEETVPMLNSRLADFGKVIVFVNDAYADFYAKNIANSRISVLPANSISDTIESLAGRN